MDPVSMLSIFSAVVAAVWTAWTWREQHKELRELQRDQAAALYVNPFLLAGHQMERQIGRLLNARELALSRREHGDRDGSVSAAAVEALWTFAGFFAWTTVNLRYGPYTRDPKVIGLITTILRTFDDRERFGDGAFRLSVAEQESLGQIVLRRLGHTSVHAGESGSSLTEFALVPAVDFERDFRDAHSPKASLYRSRAVRTTVEAIDRAARLEQLDGRARLVAVRQLVRQLLDHLERVEGFSIGVTLEGTAADASVDAPVDVASTTILHRMKGRIRLGIPEVRANGDFAHRLAGQIRTWEGVEDVSINVMAGSIAIRYRTTEPDDEVEARIVADVENAIHRKDPEARAVVQRLHPGARPERARRAGRHRARVAR
jgi:Heavy metal associated domain 2